MLYNRPTETMADAQQRTRTASPALWTMKVDKRHLGTLEEEETAAAAASDPWMRTGRPEGAPRLVSGDLESGRLLRTTERGDGPGWFGTPSMMVIAHCQLDWHENCHGNTLWVCMPVRVLPERLNCRGKTHPEVGSSISQAGTK